MRSDHALFREINARWTCAALDAFFPWLTDLNRRPLFWVVLALAAAAWLRRDRKRALLFGPALAAAVGAADVLCRLALKPLFHRLRPEHVLSGVVLRAGSHGTFGFPSNHAANCFAAAAALSLAYPRARLPALALAAIGGLAAAGARRALQVLESSP